MIFLMLEFHLGVNWYGLENILKFHIPLFKGNAHPNALVVEGLLFLFSHYMSMRIHAVSDLHLEFGPIKLPDVDRDVLVLAGDIDVGQSALEFIKREVAKSPVIYVLGNHEFYRQEYNEVLSFWTNLDLENLYVLERSLVEIDGYRFLGCTLWTNMQNGFNDAIRECMLKINDYRSIIKDGKLITVGETMIIHSESLSWLERELKTGDPSRTVVVTHHAPSARSVHRRYAGSLLNAAFYSNLDAFIARFHPKLWIHGHMHDSFKYSIGGTRVVCNPRGYFNFDENPKFDPTLVIELD